jgi:hypothetical protein
MLRGIKDLAQATGSTPQRGKVKPAHRKVRVAPEVLSIDPHETPVTL